MSIVEPHKELRFTRSRQALAFWIAAAMSLASVITILVAATSRAENSDLPHPLWALLPLVLAWFCVRIALHCTRHAYLILTPLGLEIFPFIRPSMGMQMIPWGQINDFEMRKNRLTIHFDEQKTAGIHLSLNPIPVTARTLLQQALQGRLQK